MSINKPIGLTPFDVITRLRAKDTTLTHETIGYAGRLDPMAEGLLLLLIGDENKKRKEYEKLSKVYMLTMLFGIATDTYDTLGLITEVTKVATLDADKLNSVLSSCIGTKKATLPAFLISACQRKAVVLLGSGEKVRYAYHSDKTDYHYRHRNHFRRYDFD